MSDDDPRIDTTGIVRRFVEGDDGALGVYMSRYNGALVRVGNRRIRQLGIDRADLDGEGAVNMAYLQLCQIRARGRLDSIKSSEDFLKLITAILLRVINDEKKRANAAKRGGAGGKPWAQPTPGRRGDAPAGDDTRPAAGYRRAEVDLNELVCDQPLVEDMIFSKLEYEAFLEKLNDDVLRTVLSMSREGYSIKDIARRLGVVDRTVERKLARIRLLYSEWNPERSAKEKSGSNPT